MRSGRLVAVSASLIVVSACAPPSFEACPAIYAPPGVVFRFDQLAPQTGPVELRACMDDRCVTRTDATPSTDREPLIAGAEDATGPRTVTARLVLTDAVTHAVIFDASARVTLRHIDASRCSDPDRDAYQATVRATAAGTLVPN